MLKKLGYRLVQLYELLFTTISLGRLTIAYFVLVIFSAQWTFCFPVLLLAILADLLITMAVMLLQVKLDCKNVSSFYICQDRLFRMEGWDDIVKMALDGSKTVLDQSLRNISIFHTDKVSNEPYCIPLMYGTSLVIVPDCFIKANSNNDKVSWAVYHELGHIAALHNKLTLKLYPFSAALLTALAISINPTVQVILACAASLLFTAVHNITSKLAAEMQANNEALKLAYYTEYNKYSTEQRDALAVNASDNTCLQLYRHYRDDYISELTKTEGHVSKNIDSLATYASMTNQMEFLGRCIMNDETRTILTKENEKLLARLADNAANTDSFTDKTNISDKTILKIASRDLKLNHDKHPFDPDLLKIKSFNVWTVISTVLLLVVLSLDSPAVWSIGHVSHLWLWLLCGIAIWIVVHHLFLRYTTSVRYMTKEINSNLKDS